MNRIYFAKCCPKPRLKRIFLSIVNRNAEAGLLIRRDYVIVHINQSYSGEKGSQIV